MPFDFLHDLPAPSTATPLLGARQWDGAAVLDVIGPTQGEVHREHRVVALQRWLTPLEVRVHGQTGWQRFLPEARLWLPGDEQRNEWRGPTRNQVLLLTIDHIEQVLGQPYHTTRITEWRGHHFDAPQLAALLGALSADARSAHSAPLHGETLLAQLIGWLAQGPERSAARHRPSRLTPQRLARLKDYIEAHLAEPLSLQRLAAAAGCSARLLGEAFKAGTGRSPHQYVLERRVCEAQLLLQRGALDLCEIAARLGFADQSQFSKTFRRVTGTTPGAFRARRGALSPARSAA